MLLTTVLSKNGIPIRLTNERWQHIINTHSEINSKDFLMVIDVIKNPDAILQGDVGELIAIKKHGDKTWIVVPYKEIGNQDGFILTAYQTTNNRWLFQRGIIWNKE